MWYEKTYSRQKLLVLVYVPMLDRKLQVLEAVRLHAVSLGNKLLLFFSGKYTLNPTYRIATIRCQQLGYTNDRTIARIVTGYSPELSCYLIDYFNIWQDYFLWKSNKNSLKIIFEQKKWQDGFYFMYAVYIDKKC